MYLRKYEPTDCREMEKLFYDTVHTVNAKDYTKEQLDVWATGHVDPDKWERLFLKNDTVVAVEDGIIAGFGDMNESGYLGKLFVHKDYQKRGIAAAICNRLEQASSADIFRVHASITAKPFFMHRGYRVVEELHVERGGCLLTNYLMEKENR